MKTKGDLQKEINRLNKLLEKRTKDCYKLRQELMDERYNNISREDRRGSW